MPKLTSRNCALAQSGRLAATKAIYRRADLHSGQAYDLYGWSRFATKNLAPIARRIGLQDLMRLGRGTAVVSDEMVARALLALVGVLELTVRFCNAVSVSLGRQADSSMVCVGRRAATPFTTP